LALTGRLLIIGVYNGAKVGIYILRSLLDFPAVLWDSPSRDFFLSGE